MSATTPRLRGRGEDGAYLVLYALLAVGFFTMAAVVLDIAALRQGRRADRTAADLAATAGVVELDAADPGSFPGACEAAWGYVLANRTESGGPVSPPDCPATFDSTTVCDPMTARVAVASVGPISIEITHPVPDSSPLMLAEAPSGDIAQSIEPAADGSACERLGVRIVRQRVFLFGQIAGVLGGSTDVHSVARPVNAPSSTEVPSVLALEPSGCNAVTTAGPAPNFRLGGVQGATTRQGILVADSTGASCPPPGFVIDPSVERLSAEGSGYVSSFAITSGNTARAYDPADVPALLTPNPVPAIQRLTRRLIDRRYNCTFAGCPAGSNFIDQIRTGPGSLAGPGQPPSITNLYPVAPATCTASGGLVLSGDWYVDCPTFVVPNGVTAMFTGGRIVFRGSVLIEPGGHLVVGSPAPAASNVVYLQSGDFIRQSAGARLGRFTLNQTMLYLTDTGGVDGRLQVNADDSSPNSFWTAPNQGAFEDLLLWGEASGSSFVRDTITAEGTLFLPNATLELQDQTFNFEAQVVVRRLMVVGPEDLRVFTSPDRATGVPSRQARLIR